MKKDKIISMSLKSQDLDNLNSLTNQLSLKSRSEAIRKALELLNQEQKSLESKKGKSSGVLVIIHNHSKNTLKISHTYQHLIKNQNHSHLNNDKCIDTFIIEGESSDLKQILHSFNKDKKTILSKLILI